MNFTELNDRLRRELLRRIERGTVSVSLLARQSGFGQSHLSNFLLNRRNLSLKAMDCILAAQGLTIDDLLPSVMRRRGEDDFTDIHVVSPWTAMHEAIVRPPSVQSTMPVRTALLQAAIASPPPHRRTWHRFIAVLVSLEEIEPMLPIIMPNAGVLLDRHCTALPRRREPFCCGPAASSTPSNLSPSRPVNRLRTSSSAECCWFRIPIEQRSLASRAARTACRLDICQALPGLSS